MSAVEVAWKQEDSKTEFHSLFQNAPVACLQCDGNGAVTALNPAMQRLLALAPETAETPLLAGLMHSTNRAEAERLVSELIEGTREHFRLDARTARLSEQPIRWTAWRVPNVNGTLECIVAIAEELHGAPAAEQRLRQAERLEAVGRLAGGVAHDFNNLLTGVLLYCDLLMATIEPSHRARKYADEIRKAGMQAAGLVRQLLAIARPSNSEPRPLSMNEIAEGMRNLLGRLIGENIELDLRLDPNLGLVRMEPTLAQQILLNLVLNARDAMPHGGTVTVETSNCKVQVLTESGITSGVSASLPCALLVIEDNGTGMDSSTRAHVFEPFFTTKAGKGTGLGLATVHDIVTTNGGLIHIDSQLSHGTRISVLLPLISDTAPDSFQPNNFHPAKSGQVLSSKEEE